MGWKTRDERRVPPCEKYQSIKEKLEKIKVLSLEGMKNNIEQLVKTMTTHHEMMKDKENGMDKQTTDTTTTTRTAVNSKHLVWSSYNRGI